MHSQGGPHFWTCLVRKRVRNICHLKIEIKFLQGPGTHLPFVCLNYFQLKRQSPQQLLSDRNFVLRRPCEFGSVQKDALKLTQVCCPIGTAWGAPFAKGKVYHDRATVQTYNTNAAQRKHKAYECVQGIQLVCQALPCSSSDHTRAASCSLWKALSRTLELLLTAKADKIKTISETIASLNLH